MKPSVKRLIDLPEWQILITRSYHMTFYNYLNLAFIYILRLLNYHFLNLKLLASSTKTLALFKNQNFDHRQLIAPLENVSSFKRLISHNESNNALVSSVLLLLSKLLWPLLCC
jgi:hypothetical protein